MSDTAYPNILVVNPDGTISAALSGNLTIAADVSSSASGVNPQHAVTWLEGSGRVAQVGALQNPTASRNNLLASATSPDGRAVGLLGIAASNDSSLLQAWCFQDGSPKQLATILGDDGSSSFLQQASASPAKIQWGSARVNVPNTAALVNVPLAQAWATVHLFFIATVTAAPVGFDFQLIRGCWPNDSRSGEIFFDSSSAQTLSINYLSIGY